MILSIFFFIYTSFVSAKTLYESIANDFVRKDRCKSLNKKVSVFFYKDDYRFFPDNNEQCKDHCKLVDSQKDADLILWHVATQPHAPAKSHSKQKIGAVGQEPFYDIQKFRSLSDFTVSYAYDNDLIIPYIEDFFYRDILNAKPPTEEEFKKLKTAVFICANCGVKERTEFVRNLMKLIPIDSKGPCLNNSPIISGHWAIIRNELKNRYKFYISIEKTKEEGYISEKFHNGFIVNSIPVYYGTNQSDQFVSPDSYLHVTSLSDHESIAAQIQRISNNYTEWLALFNNRKKSFHRSEEVIKWIEYINYGGNRRHGGNLCRMCDYYCDKYA